jgi:hypothetical protein
MRMMSFALTERQLMDGSKTVTRRTGWQNLRAGDRLLAVRKAMGLKKGEKIHPLCEIEVVSVRREYVGSIMHEPGDARREGFPDMTEADFADFFCKKMRATLDTPVNRIEFRKVPGSERVAVQQDLV